MPVDDKDIEKIKEVLERLVTDVDNIQYLLSTIFNEKIARDPRGKDASICLGPIARILKATYGDYVILEPASDPTYQNPRPINTSIFVKVKVAVPGLSEIRLCPENNGAIDTSNYRLLVPLSSPPGQYETYIPGSCLPERNKIWYICLMGYNSDGDFVPRDNVTFITEP